MVCVLDKNGRTSEKRIVGSLDDKQRRTLDVVAHEGRPGDLKRSLRSRVHGGNLRRCRRGTRRSAGGGTPEGAGGPRGWIGSWLTDFLRRFREFHNLGRLGDWRPGGDGGRRAIGGNRLRLEGWGRSVAGSRRRLWRGRGGWRDRRFRRWLGLWLGGQEVIDPWDLGLRLRFRFRGRRAGRSGGFNGRVLLVLVAEIPIVVLDVREDPAALRAAQGPPAAIPVWSVLAARVTVLAAVLFDEAKARTTVRTRKGRRLSHVAASMHGAPHKSIRVDCWTRFSVEAFLPTAWLVWALPP